MWFILAILFFAAELKPPTNINITTSGNNVTVTWTLPGESERNTYLGFYLSGNMDVETYTYINPPQSSFTVTLTSCKKYRLNMDCSYFKNRWSKTVEKTFWVTGK